MGHRFGRVAAPSSEVNRLPEDTESPTLSAEVKRVGRLAQLVRAPALQAGCRGFESLTAHHKSPVRADFITWRRKRLATRFNDLAAASG